MKLLIKYFKDEATQKSRRDELSKYTKAMDAKCKAEYAATPLALTIVRKSHALIATAWGYLRVGVGNTKVFFPTVNFESGLTCSSSGHCQYSYKNKRLYAAANKKLPPRERKKGKPLCYAQKLEGAFPDTMYVKAYQATVCERIAKKATVEQQQEAAFSLTAAALALKGKYPFVRVSEVGDIGPVVAPFAHKVLSTMVDTGLRPYLYTKRAEAERVAMVTTGATVLVSDTDFVCVDSAADAAAQGLAVCPGECGGPKHKCFRCPLGKITAVVGH